MPAIKTIEAGGHSYDVVMTDIPAKEFTPWTKDQVFTCSTEEAFRRVLNEPGALGEQVGGEHYKSMPIQPAEFIHKNNIGYLQGNVIKYVCRHASKGGPQDIRKAIHYCRLILKLQYGEDE
jgi:hypothetical protein